MAKKTASLTFREIVLGAEADVIRQALEARLQIDQLVEERRRAYERIAELETQVEDVIGESGTFPFPAPPLPVAGLDPKADTVTRASGGTSKKSARASAPAASASKDDASDEAAPDADATQDDATSTDDEPAQ